MKASHRPHPKRAADDRVQSSESTTLPKSIDDKIRKIQSDIEQLKQADGNQYREQMKAAEHGPLLLSGHYVELVIEGVEM